MKERIPLRSEYPQESYLESLDTISSYEKDITAYNIRRHATDLFIELNKSLSLMRALGHTEMADSMPVLIEFLKNYYLCLASPTISQTIFKANT